MASLIDWSWTKHQRVPASRPLAVFIICSRGLLSLPDADATPGADLPAISAEDVQLARTAAARASPVA
jgi:hypothetical protein